jgi:hypothetical protein
MMQQFPVRGVKDEEKPIGGAPDGQQTATAPVCTTPESVGPRRTGQGTVRGREVGERVHTGKKTARAVDGGAQRVRSPDEVGLRAGVGVFEIDL